MTYMEEDEMTDAEIKLRYGSLIREAAAAFTVDSSYAADIAKKARMVKAREARRNP